jgi:hypothetical protein
VVVVVVVVPLDRRHYCCIPHTQVVTMLIAVDVGDCFLQEVVVDVHYWHPFARDVQIRHKVIWLRFPPEN